MAMDPWPNFGLASITKQAVNPPAVEQQPGDTEWRPAARGYRVKTAVLIFAENDGCSSYSYHQHKNSLATNIRSSSHPKKKSKKWWCPSWVYLFIHLLSSRYFLYGLKKEDRQNYLYTCI